MGWKVVLSKRGCVKEGCSSVVSLINVQSFFKKSEQSVRWQQVAVYVKMKASLRLRVLTIPQKLGSISLPKEHLSQQTNFEHKETTLPVRPPEGNQLGARQSVWLSSLETKSKVFPTLFLLSFLKGAWERKKKPIVIVYYHHCLWTHQWSSSLCAL